MQCQESDRSKYSVSRAIAPIHVREHDLEKFFNKYKVKVGRFLTLAERAHEVQCQEGERPQPEQNKNPLSCVKGATVWFHLSVSC